MEYNRDAMPCACEERPESISSLIAKSEDTKVKSANSLLTLLTLAAAENKVKKSGGSEDISELIKIILQNEENSDRN